MSPTGKRSRAGDGAPRINDASQAASHRWEFQARFRRHTFGWKSQPAIQRIKQAVSEIKKVARRDPVLAADSAVLFLERVSPAIEHVDGSSGAIGNAVNRVIDELAPIIVAAPVGATTREVWLERLWEAHASDKIPYIERLADHWGELCGSKQVASAWADRLLDISRMALSPDRNLRGHLQGTATRKRPEDILADLVKAMPGEEGKWFTAAKELGLYNAAIELARASPCDPKTLARAARDHVAKEPTFAVEAGYTALDWLAQGLGYEITGADVWMAYTAAMKAAEALDRAFETKERIRKLAESQYSFVTEILGRELKLPRGS